MSEALYSSLDAMTQSIQEMGNLPAAWWDVMMHRVPSVPCVDRVQWLTQRLAGKVIMHLGCKGPVHERLLKVCTRAYGIDRGEASYPDYLRQNLDDLSLDLPRIDSIDIILAGEVLEHLLAPGLLLTRIRDVYTCPVILTVPNAGSSAFQAHLKRGYEQVNQEHVCWYSWRTLTTLVERCGYTVREWYWYGGKPLTSEGLLFVVE